MADTPTTNWLEASTRASNYQAAWAELAGYVKHRADRGAAIDPAALLDYLEEIHQRYGLPPQYAPKRD